MDEQKTRLIQTLNAIIQEHHKAMDDLEPDSERWNEVGYSLVRYQLRLDRIKHNAELDALRAENARLAALVSEAASALRYYADPGNYLDWRGKVVDDASYAALVTLAKLGDTVEESEEGE